MSFYSTLADCDAKGCGASISTSDSLYCQSCYDELLSKIEKLESEFENLKEEYESYKDSMLEENQ